MKSLVLMLGISIMLLPSVSAMPIEFTPSLGLGIGVAVIIVVAAIIVTFFALWGGIKYVTPENVLDKEIRRTIYSYIDEYPGSHLREIARDLDLKPSNVEWHLRKLEQCNLIRSRKIGGKKVYYLVEGGIQARKRAIAESILRNKNARRIMEYLRNNPGKHLLEIAKALNLNHHTVKWHLKKMIMAEMVEGDRSNSAYPVYFPTELGIEALEKSVSNKFQEQIKRMGRGS